METRPLGNHISSTDSNEFRHVCQRTYVIRTQLIRLLFQIDYTNFTIEVPEL
jgi:hypothetical protein